LSPRSKSLLGVYDHGKKLCQKLFVNIRSLTY
jgi:hypothetical protein